MGNLPGREDGLPSTNRIVVNVDGTQFRAAPEYGADYEIGAEACAVGSDAVSGDWADLFVCTASIEHGLVLYRNEGGSALHEETNRWGFDGVRAQQVLVEDLDANGGPEIVVVTPPQVMIWTMENGAFTKAMTMPHEAGRDVALGDVDGDDDLDLYVLQGGGTPCADPEAEATRDDQPDYILLRDGEGLSEWSKHPAPHTGRGCGDGVVSIDHDGDGRDEFLVLNGDRSSVGPIQLITAE